jgi:multiple sugar transport system substrate-binding protein
MTRRAHWGPLDNWRRGRAVVVGGLSASMLAVSVLGTSTVAEGATKSAQAAHITLSEIDYYTPGLPQWAAFQWLFSQYEKTHPNITVARQTVSGSDLESKELALATTHSLPDLALADNTYMPNLVATGQWVNLKPDLTKWGQMKDYLAASWPQLTFNGGIYGMQDGLNDLGLIYNTKIFAEAGITTVPKTWSQLLSDSKTIVTKVKGLTYGAVGFGAADNGCGASWQFLPWIYQQGLDINDLTSPGMIAAVNFWATLLKDGYANKEVITQCQSTNIPQLVDGQLAMVETGQWDFPTLAADHFNDWGTFPIPLRSAKDHSASPMGGEVWTVPKTNTAGEAAAWNFLQWSQQPAIEYEFDLKLNYTPARPALWPAFEKALPRVTPFVQELKYSVGRTAVLGLKFPTYETVLGTALVQVLEGQQSARSALSAALASAKRTLASES